MKNFIIGLILIVLSITPVFAESSGGGAASWLKIGVGVRAKGMGSAFSGVADDVSAIYYNPAGIGQIKQRELSFTTSSMSLERKQNFIAYSHPIDGTRNFTLSWTGFSIDDAMGINEWGTVEGKFDFKNNAFTLGYSYEFLEGAYFGFNAKYIESKFKGLTYTNNASGDGYGFDVGILYEINHNYKLGLSVADISTQLKWDTGKKEDLPKIYRLGVSSLLLADKLLLSGELEHETFSDETKINMGIEYWIKKNIGLRAGMRDDNITAGFSYYYKYENLNLKFDYAYVQDNFSDVLSEDDTHIFGLGFNF